MKLFQLFKLINNTYVLSDCITRNKHTPLDATQHTCYRVQNSTMQIAE